MARYKSTVENLAAEAGLTVEDAIFFICEAGVRLMSSNVVSPKWLARARKALELPDTPLRLAFTTNEKHSNILLKVDSATDLAASIPPCPSKKKVIEWRQIGRIQHLEYLTAKEVEKIHWVLVEDFKMTADPIEPPGVRSENLLNSAIHRTQTTLGGERKYSSVAMAAAAMVFGLILNHPFHNGNKRTAMVSMLVFLDKNGIVVKDIDELDLYEFFLKIAGHELINGSALSPDEETMLIAEWIHRRTRRLEKIEYLIKFHELKRILSRHGANIYNKHGNMKGIIRILGRRELQSKVSARNEGAEIERETMQKIRYELELDEDHGYDSDIFYNAEKKIPEFINKYRTVLNRLAKV